MAKHTSIRLPEELIFKINRTPGQNFTDKVIYLLNLGLESTIKDDKTLERMVLHGTKEDILFVKNNYPAKYGAIVTERYKKTFAIEEQLVNKLKPEDVKLKYLRDFNYLRYENRLHFYSLYEWTYVQFMFDKYPIPYDTDIKENDEDGYHLKIILPSYEILIERGLL